MQDAIDAEAHPFCTGQGLDPQIRRPGAHGVEQKCVRQRRRFGRSMFRVFELFKVAQETRNCVHHELCLWRLKHNELLIRLTALDRSPRLAKVLSFLVPRLAEVIRLVSHTGPSGKKRSTFGKLGKAGAAGADIMVGMKAGISKLDDRLAIWNVCESDYPFSGQPWEKLSFCLNYAVLAP